MPSGGGSEPKNSRRGEKLPLTHAGRLPGPGRGGWKDERTQGPQRGGRAVHRMQHSEGSRLVAGNDRLAVDHAQAQTHLMSLKSTSGKKPTVPK